MKPKRYWRKEKIYSKTGETEGVYFLMDKKRVVYIGHGWSVYGRAMSHKNKDWTWDRVRLIAVHGFKNRAKYEKRLIKLFRPKYNVQHNPGYLMIGENGTLRLTRDINDLSKDGYKIYSI